MGFALHALERGHRRRSSITPLEEVNPYLNTAIADLREEQNLLGWRGRGFSVENENAKRKNEELRSRILQLEQY